VVENLGLAVHCARRWTRGRGWLREDYESAALGGLINAARAFDPCRGKRFAALAGVSIRHALIATDRSRLLARRCCPTRLLSMDGDDDERLLQLEPTIAGRFCDGSPDFEGLIVGLPALAIQVMRLRYAGGLSARAIGRRLGITRFRAATIDRQSRATIARWID
jgi:DNA-directed RNA polymerase specialized sigma subunit